MYRLGSTASSSRSTPHRADSSHAWGLRYTLWTDAPILDQPSREVCWDKKRQVRIYMNGTAIHRIAVFYGGSLQDGRRRGRRINNSLDDELSPETMIAIAKSLVPARRAPA